VSVAVRAHYVARPSAPARPVDRDVLDRAPGGPRSPRSAGRDGRTRPRDASTTGRCCGWRRAPTTCRWGRPLVKANPPLADYIVAARAELGTERGQIRGAIWRAGATAAQRPRVGAQ